MVLVAKGMSSAYEIENLLRVFFPSALPRKGAGTKGQLAYARITRTRLAAGLRLGPITMVLTAPRPAAEKEATRALSGMLYRLLRQATGIRPPWGMLTGVRPGRLYYKSSLLGGHENARRMLVEQYDITPQKLALIEETARLQQPYLQRVKPRHYSLYVSIPFCPTRCSYCSFVSRTTRQDAVLLEPYVEKLELELAAIARLAQEHGLQLQTIYVGGGTPTSLSAPLLRRLLKTIQCNFPVKDAAEYTVEAGRPDCTDKEKLALLQEFGVGRISINPQSMNNEVLHAIGRLHGAGDVHRCFAEARAVGHANINMDLIAGLPKDTPQSFEKSLREVLHMQPENITLHTLTLKRASNMVVEGAAQSSPPEKMIEQAYPLLQKAGYRPYYLYRQKNTVNNLENTGWALPGKEGLYNIAIMEELHSILSAGAGGSTKMVACGGKVIRRVFNYKYPAEYIKNFDAVLAKKREVKEFYARYLDPETPGGDWVD